MSDIIHLLPDSVANQIAAGEVIQRPASVIKELVENSIDAGASLIQVFVIDAGKTSIQVVDDGKGMSETDARLSFERHATSKISKANDLFALRTMGFRGEALASIAAVAQVELKTRRAEDELGVHITVEGSRFKGQELISCSQGANFLVRNLFYNIPARRKFLKSNSTEMSNIVAEFERIALANPQVSFRLTNGDTIILDLPKGNLRQRIVNIFGRRIDNYLIPVQVDTSLVKINGFVGSPESSRKKGVQQYFFVNGRYMRHIYFSKAVFTAFERLIPEGEQIPYFLSFEVDPANIDVNIHPTKTEIKFEDEQAIWQILLATIRESLGKSNAIPSIDFEQVSNFEIPIQNKSSYTITSPEITINQNFNPFETNRNTKDESTSFTFNKPPHSSVSSSQWQSAFEGIQLHIPKENEEKSFLTLPFDNEDEQLEQKLAYVQFQNRYIISPAKNHLLVIDQQRAHQRILYDYYLELLSGQTGVSQGLLFPLEIELSPSDIIYYEHLEPSLLRAGFELIHIKNTSLIELKGIPAGTEGIDAIVFIQDIIAQARSGEVQAEEKINHLLASTLANKRVIPAGQQMTIEEMTHLVEALFHTNTPTLTPEGAKIIVTIEEAILEGMF